MGPTDLTRPSRLLLPVRTVDHAQGPAGAPYTLVEYGDYECPDCGRLYVILRDFQREIPSKLTRPRIGTRERERGVIVEIDELELSTRADGVLKEAGIDTVEDLCLFTRDQLLHLGNFGRKSLDEVENTLKERSLCPNRGPANPQLLVSSIKVGQRFNLAFSVLNGDRASLARYTVRELARTQDSLLEVVSQSTGSRTGHAKGPAASA